MKSYLLLAAQKNNWGVISDQSWEVVSWEVYSDGFYSVRILFPGGESVGKSGKMRKDRFSALCDAMDQEWTSELTGGGNEGEAWIIKQFLPDGSVCKSSGKLGYIYGQETLERIVSLLPGKTFVLEHEFTPEEVEIREEYRNAKSTKTIKDRGAAGYIVSRFYGRKKNRSITLELRLETTLIPFAMDLEHSLFLVFMIKRRRDLNIFVWVSLDDGRSREKVRFTAVNEFMTYTKWTGEAMDCSGSYPEEMIARALAILDGCSLAELRAAYDSMTEKMNEIGGYEHWRETERDVLKAVNEARIQHHGIVDL